jgi:hypothetical protein
MIKIEADNMLDLRSKLRGFFPSKIGHKITEGSLIDLANPSKYILRIKTQKEETIKLNENPDEITIILPTKYRSKNIFILYSDK